MFCLCLTFQLSLKIMFRTTSDLTPVYLKPCVNMRPHRLACTDIIMYGIFVATIMMGNLSRFFSTQESWRLWHPQLRDSMMDASTGLLMSYRIFSQTY